MCEYEKDGRAWLDELVPKILKRLGKNPENPRYDFSVPGDAYYLSSMFLVNIEQEDENEPIRVVVKRHPQIEALRYFIKSDKQFHNEILFYRKYAKDREHYAECIYVEENSAFDSIIVLENIGSRGYEPCPWRYDIPLKYTLAAMREIGRFHAEGYIMKNRREEDFFEMVRDIRETRYEVKEKDRFHWFLNKMALRPIVYLRSHGYDPVFCDKVEDFLSNAFQNVFVPGVKPDEPLSVLCHGDFTLNNALFKNEGGKFRAMLLDFGTIRYCTPAIDLSTFVCLYCPAELKEERFKVVFQEYYDSLRKHLVAADIEDLERYSHEALYEDFKQKALIGFCIATFYLSTVMGKNPVHPEQVIKMDIKEAAEKCYEAGGEEMSKLLADILIDLKDFGCLDRVL
ncbi:hypothetical protein KM043_005112 [Ampulex compressa]|nr:hypothetical protein KM043_005112 [Ampulex compressa]